MTLNSLRVERSLYRYRTSYELELVSAHIFLSKPLLGFHSLCKFLIAAEIRSKQLGVSLEHQHRFYTYAADIASYPAGLFNMSLSRIRIFYLKLFAYWIPIRPRLKHPDLSLRINFIWTRRVVITKSYFLYTIYIAHGKSNSIYKNFKRRLI